MYKTHYHLKTGCLIIILTNNRYFQFGFGSLSSFQMIFNQNICPSSLSQGVTGCQPWPQWLINHQDKQCWCSCCLPTWFQLGNPSPASLTSSPSVIEHLHPSLGSDFCPEIEFSLGARGAAIPLKLQD